MDFTFQDVVLFVDGFDAQLDNVLYRQTVFHRVFAYHNKL